MRPAARHLGEESLLKQKVLEVVANKEPRILDCATNQAEMTTPDMGAIPSAAASEILVLFNPSPISGGDSPSPQPPTSPHSHQIETGK